MAILQNEFLRLDFDDATGALTGLLNKKTGWQAIRQPKLAQGVILMVPVPAHRKNRTLPELQKLSHIHVEGGSAELCWEQMAGEKSGILDISATLRVSLKEDTASFTLTIDNRSPYIVEEAWCPAIGGLREPEGEAPLTAGGINFVGNLERITFNDESPFSNLGYWGIDYPTKIQTYPAPFTHPFAVLENGTQGMYLGVHDDEINVVNFLYELRPGYSDAYHSQVPAENEIGGKPAGFMVNVVRLPFVQPGEKAELAPVILRMYSGGWMEGADTYKAYRKTWFELKSSPSWLRRTDCWMTLHINSPEGCCRYRYSELPALMREAKQYGVDTLQLIGWAVGGQDGDEPYQDIDERLGTKEELQAAIREIEDEIGIKVLLMCKFKWVDQSNPAYEKELAEHTIRDLYGNPIFFGGYTYQTMLQHLHCATRDGYGLCHLSEGARKIILRELDKVLELGSAGLLYDESNAMVAHVCFDASHGHKKGECTYKGMLKLAEEFYNRVTEKNPDYILAGEGTPDRVSQYYPVNYIRSAYKSYVPALQYVNEEAICATCVTGFDDREMLNQCMVYGFIINYEPYNFKGKISDFPLTAEYGRKCLALREACREYLHFGKFCYTRGADVAADCEFIYSVFENGTGNKAVVVANQSSEDCLFKVKTEGVSSFESFSPEEMQAVLTDGNLVIPARSLRVFIEKK